MLYITAINTGLIVLATLVHFETLNLLDKWLPRIQFAHRFRLVIGVLGTITAHIAEIWLFGFGYWGLIKTERFGILTGNVATPATLFDCVYFSLVNYTTLGFGDILANGHLRFLAGLEALTGLVLITWSASFLFIEMRRFWRKE